FRGRAEWDSGKTTFWDGRMLVAGPNRYAASAAYGEQGVWRIAGFVDAFTRSHTETARTPFEGAGTSSLTLPSSWTSTASALNLAGLRQPLNPLELKTDWRTAGGEVVLAPRNGFELRFKFEHRDRNGLRESSLNFGHEANFPSAVFFPYAIDYSTDRVNAALAYAADGLSWDVSYGYHAFNDAKDSMLVQNPYARSTGIPWPGGAFAGFPRSFAQYSTPPDSVAHRFAVTGSWVAAPRTRVSLRVSRTVQKQNEPFLPYSPVQQLVVTTPRPRASLDGKIRKTFANVSITSREIENVDLAASYTLDDRDNLTPIDLYNYIPGDAQDQAVPFVPGVSRYIRFNLPHSFKFQKAKAEIGYRPIAGTRISLNYTGDFKDRDYQQVAESNEHAITAKVQSTFESASGWISASHVRRNGSPYDDAVAWDASHAANYLAAGPQNQSIEYELLFRHYLADRKRSVVRAGYTVDVIPEFAVSASLGRARDRYQESRFGLRQSRSLIAGFDAVYNARDLVTVVAYYTYERFTFDQKGYYIATNRENDPAQEWTARTKDATHTVGGQVDWQAVPDKLKLSGLFTRSDGGNAIDVQATGFVPLARVSALPDVVERTTRAGLSAEYAFKPDLAIRLGYAHEKHITRDWAYDNTPIAPVSQLIGAGIVSPRYSAHVVTVATRVAY
ncbi:MAG: MtrB/PioB family decaheme-associated outer membrane protein, partial [Alphaproteobacteria bacterium]|nr:MtrB/PioB family decaheme-associated outer membrane protein [Alphaproteobacteria bacterium]